MKRSLIFLLAVLCVHMLPAQWNHNNIDRKFDAPRTDGKIHFDGFKQSSHMNKYDVGFYFLDIALERTSTYVDGKVTITARVTSATLDTFAVELIDELTVNSVLINGVSQTFTHNNDHIYAAPSMSLAQGSVFTAEIDYQGNPATGGGFFSGITSDDSPTWGNWVTWTLSEPWNANQWWPCKQVLTDKADSSWVFITTSNTNKAGSNGLLTAVVTQPNNKLRYEWKSTYPIAYYLISASVAKYVEYNIWAHPVGTTDSLLIQNYVYDNPSTLPYFKSVIDLTDDFIELYSELMGTYPFMREKYGHCMAPLGGGMEHQTMTTLGNFNFYLVCHELAHMWFGDNVTCATWSDIWVNEGFASYGEYLAAQYLDSYNEAQSHMEDVHSYVMSEPGGSVYIPPADADDENRVFSGRLSYDKGSAIIHMIRFEIQDDTLFFNTLKTFQDDFRDSVATGMDFKNTAETVSGLDFTDFFDQWYFGEGYPTYHISWYQANNTLHFTATQTTSTMVTPLFKMLMEYKVKYSGGDTLIRVYQTANVNTFSIPFNKTVTGMEVDPENWVLDGPPSVVAAMEDHHSPLYFTLAPNPCKDQLNLYFANGNPGDVAVSVLDITGRTVMTQPASVIVNTSSLPGGAYFLVAESPEGRIIKRFLKE